VTYQSAISANRLLVLKVTDDHTCITKQIWPTEPSKAKYTYSPVDILWLGVSRLVFSVTVNVCLTFHTAKWCKSSFFVFSLPSCSVGTGYSGLRYSGTVMWFGWDGSDRSGYGRKSKLLTHFAVMYNTQLSMYSAWRTRYVVE